MVVGTKGKMVCAKKIHNRRAHLTGAKKIPLELFWGEHDQRILLKPGKQSLVSFPCCVVGVVVVAGVILFVFWHWFRAPTKSRQIWR